MFSGIIKATGIVKNIVDTGTTKRLTIASDISSGLKVDQSISHDGVCLTIVAVKGDTHDVQVVLETLSKTNLGNLMAGDIINLEKSITTETLLDGHLVQGHVDTKLKCIDIEDRDGSWKYSFELPDQYAALMVPQGSVAINGVSLTVAELQKGQFAVSIIPYTYHHTNFKNLRRGDEVNIEFDLVGKYILRQIQLRDLTE